jgi:hypothetical protein
MIMLWNLLICLKKLMRVKQFHLHESECSTATLRTGIFCRKTTMAPLVESGRSKGRSQQGTLRGRASMAYFAIPILVALLWSAGSSSIPFF